MPGQIYPNYEAPTINIQGTPVAATPPVDGNILIYSGPARSYIPGDPIVSGPEAPGTTPVSFPVQIGGESPNQTVTRIQTDLNGNVEVDSSLLLDVLKQILLELRSIRYAIVALDPTLQPDDFDPGQLTEDTEVTTQFN